MNINLRSLFAKYDGVPPPNDIDATLLFSSFLTFISCINDLTNSGIKLSTLENLLKSQ